MTSKNLAKKIIKQFEGLRLTPYYCPAKLKTIGYGHVMRPDEQQQLGNRITESQAEQLLEQDIAQAKSALYRNCSVYLNPNQQAALISFIFNCGSGAFQSSGLRQKLNRGEYEDAADELPKWVHSRGVRLKGLVKRRALERSVFLEKINADLTINRGAVNAKHDENDGITNFVTGSVKGFFGKIRQACTSTLLY